MKYTYKQAIKNIKQQDNDSNIYIYIKNHNKTHEYIFNTLQQAIAYYEKTHRTFRLAYKIENWKELTDTLIKTLEENIPQEEIIEYNNEEYLLIDDLTEEYYYENNPIQILEWLYGETEEINIHIIEIQNKKELRKNEKGIYKQTQTIHTTEIKPNNTTQNIIIEKKDKNGNT